MVTPIIIPITNTRTRDCIIQEGVRYCESQNASPKDVGIILGCVALYFVYVGLVFYFVEKSDTYNQLEWVFFWAMIVPLIVGSVVLLAI